MVVDTPGFKKVYLRGSCLVRVIQNWLEDSLLSGLDICSTTILSPSAVKFLVSA